MAVRTPVLYDGTDIIEMTAAQIQTVKDRVRWLWGDDDYRSGRLINFDFTNGYQTDYRLNSMDDTRDTAGTAATNRTSHASNNPGATNDAASTHATFQVLYYNQHRTDEFESGLQRNFYYVETNPDGDAIAIREFTVDDMLDTFIKPAIEDIVTASDGPGKYRIHTGGSASPPANHSHLLGSTAVFTDTRYGGVDGGSYWLAVGLQSLMTEPDISTIEPFIASSSVGPSNVQGSKSDYDAQSTYLNSFILGPHNYFPGTYNDGSGLPGNEYSTQGIRYFPGIVFRGEGTGSSYTAGFDFDKAGLPDFHSYFSFSAGSSSSTNTEFQDSKTLSTKRAVEIPGIQLKSLKKIKFYVIRGSGGPYLPSNQQNGGETPDAGENLYFQLYAGHYNTSSGSWRTLQQFNYNDTTYNDWTQYTYTVTDSAKKLGGAQFEGDTTLRWVQPKASGSTFDTWGLTGIEFEFESDLDIILARHLNYAVENVTGYRIRYEITGGGNTISDIVIGGPFNRGDAMLDTTFNSSTRVNSGPTNDIYTSQNVPAGSAETESTYRLQIYRY